MRRIGSKIGVVVVIGFLGALAGCDDGDDGGGPEGADCVRDRVLVATSDFARARLGVVDLASGAVTLASSDAADIDTAPAVIGCTPILLERGAGTVKRQDADAPLTTRATIVLDPETAETPYATNPQAVAPVDGERAYVAPSAKNELLLVNVLTGEEDVEASVDLSAFVAVGDADGVVDLVDAARVGDRVYAALGNYWFDGAPDFVQHFEGSVLAVVDVATGELVDMDESAAGTQGIELTNENPWRGLHADAAGERLYVGAGGNSFALDGAIEIVDLESGASTGTLVTEVELAAELNGFALGAEGDFWVLAGDSLQRADDVDSTLEEVASGFKGFVLADDSVFAWGDAGLFQYDAQTGQDTTPAAGPWTFGDLPIVGAAVVP